LWACKNARGGQALQEQRPDRAVTGGIRGEKVRDLIAAAVGHSFGRVNRLPGLIERLTDNGSLHLARETAYLKDLASAPRTTPLRSLQSIGVVEAFVGVRAHAEARRPGLSCSGC